MIIDYQSLDLLKILAAWVAIGVTIIVLYVQISRSSGEPAELVVVHQLVVVHKLKA